MKVPTELVGARVERTAFDERVRLSLRCSADGDGYVVDAELAVGTPFLLRDADGRWHELEPGGGTALAPVLGLRGRTITAVAISERGALTLDFDDGAQLFLGPHIRLDSWSLTGAGVAQIRIGPGGQTDRWQ
jgi:Family of unknown function (DUF6188)